MQLGTSTFIWVSPFSSKRLDLFAHAARLGSDVLEICIEDPALIRPDEIAEAAAVPVIGELRGVARALSACPHRLTCGSRAARREDRPDTRKPP